MYTAYLLLGSNLGNRELQLEQAKTLIGNHCGTIIYQSSLYETAAWGITTQPSFYNQIIILKTKLIPEGLMQSLLQIEETMGRIRTIKYGPRNIDIDIQLIDNITNNSQLLVLPHPFLSERRFALLPLSEVAPNVIHPILNKTISQLLHECSDTLEVKKLVTLTHSSAF